jgi:hypothetical protein
VRVVGRRPRRHLHFEFVQTADMADAAVVDKDAVGKELWLTLNRQVVDGTPSRGLYE